MHDDDDPPPQKNYPLSPAKMSKTPSWIMLGFLLGVLFMFVLRDRQPPPVAPPPPPAAPETTEREPRTPPPLSRIEGIFEAWGQHAVWSEDVTEVAMWDEKEERFADYYEVRRLDGKLYFRSIPKLTRRVIERGKPMPDCPLKFTETEAQYQEWQEYGRRERPIQRMWEPPARKTNNAPVPAPTVQPGETKLPTAPSSIIDAAPKVGPSGGK